MGLDQYMYAASKAKDSEINKRELAYRRKHPNLHGWMEKLWLKKLGIPLYAEDQFIQNLNRHIDFNGVELELTYEDIVQLEQDIRSGKMARMDTQGFFFGRPSDEHYYDEDLKFCVDAKAELFFKFKVFYNSSW
jgi:hypothetical protein